MTRAENESDKPTGGNSTGTGTTGTARRELVLIAMMLVMFMAAIEATIVATAMPSIVSVLGGFRLFSWVFSVFLLCQAITIPIYGKLADLYGRKPVFFGGTGLFLLAVVVLILCLLIPRGISPKNNLSARNQ